MKKSRRSDSVALWNTPMVVAQLSNAVRAYWSTPKWPHDQRTETHKKRFKTVWRLYENHLRWFSDGFWWIPKAGLRKAFKRSALEGLDGDNAVIKWYRTLYELTDPYVTLPRLHRCNHFWSKGGAKESGNERTEKEGEIRRKIANHRKLVASCCSAPARPLKIDELFSCIIRN